MYMISNMFHIKDPASVFCRLIKNVGVGRFAFHIRVLELKIENLMGRFNQRSVEYPWILQHIGCAGDRGCARDRTLLDVGCSGSLLDHELLARGFRVVGLDIHNHTMRNDREPFIQANILKSGLPSESFDIILLVSTLEHIGLNVYSQNLLTDDGDFLAIREVHRLLKSDGLCLLTIPYECSGPARIFQWGENGKIFVERRYDYKRLAKLLTDFTVVDSAFFLCLKYKFVRVQKQFIDKLSGETCEGSLACLVLRKKRLS